jgi:broad specificity phosphatase PhoE
VTETSGRRTWYLVRHGETEWNAISRMQGQLDSPLTLLGREHARASGRLLAVLGVDAMFASPLGRVRETMAIIEEAVPLPVTFDDRLKEWSAGIWSGEFHSDLRHKWPEHWAEWDADRYTYRPPGAENLFDLTERARAFFDDIRHLPAARIAIVAHGFMNRALAGVLLSLSPREMLAIRQANDTVIRITTGEGAPAVDHFVHGAGPRAGLPGLATDAFLQNL